MSLPRAVKVDGERVTIDWSDGHTSIYANKRLRDACPCAACKGESGLLGRVYAPASPPDSPPGVRATGYSMVGRYAVSFTWSDGHSSGIYPYEYLLELCECERCRGGGERSP